jgi:hypothetical protein
MRCLTFLAVASMALAAGASAQSPYAGLQTRPIKALSEQQIADLRAGRGMGLALPAELNGYPGPVHLLELGDRIGLSPGQREAIQRLYDSMKAEAVPLGERLIEQEATLDRLFADHTATVANVADAVAAIGETQGRLRLAHLKYHLSTVALLQPGQIERYRELRGYGDGQPSPHRHH